MVRPLRRDDADGGFDAGEGLKACFAGVLGMGWLWEVGKSFAWTLFLS